MALDPLSQMEADARAGNTPAPVSLPTAPPTLTPIDQLEAHERADRDGAARIVGESETAREQDGYASQIKAQAQPTSWTHYTEQVVVGALHGVANIPTEMAEAVKAMSGTWSGEILLHSMGAPGHALDAAGKLATAVGFSPRAAINAVLPTIDTRTGSVAEGITQFAVGMIPAMRAAKLASLGTTATTMLAGGATSAAFFNPDSPRLSN